VTAHQGLALTALFATAAILLARWRATVRARSADRPRACDPPRDDRPDRFDRPARSAGQPDAGAQETLREIEQHLSRQWNRLHPLYNHPDESSRHRGR
jgi:hypothetical protein